MKEKVGMTDNKNTNYENQLEVKQILLRKRKKWKCYENEFEVSPYTTV